MTTVHLVNYKNTTKKILTFEMPFVPMKGDTIYFENKSYDVMSRHITITQKVVAVQNNVITLHVRDENDNFDI